MVLYPKLHFIFIFGNPDLRVEASTNELLLYKGHNCKHTTDDYHLVLLTQSTNSCYSKPHQQTLTRDRQIAVKKSNVMSKFAEHNDQL